MTRPLILWAPVAAYMAAIFYSSSQPDVPLPHGLGDKSSHTLGYTLLGLLVVRALVGGLGARVTRAAALLGIALTAAYGATDEIHQTFVPGRSAEWYDLAADAVGGAIGALLCWLCGIISPALSRVEGPSRHGL